MSDDLREFLAQARGGSGLVATARVMSLDELRARRGALEEVTEPWGLAALRGRLVELSARGATATLTAATELVLEAQTAGEPVVWIMLANGTFYPPDVAESGVDLAALVIVRALDATGAARAAERLLRSGAFGLVVMDLAGLLPGVRDTHNITMAHQGRLVTLAQAHDAAVVCITDKPEDTASLGSLVSLRTEALRSRPSGSRDFELTLRAIKDKRRGPGWTRKRIVRGPAGL
ncbi:MAG: recombinase A [Myxococcota bacterium]|nr:recombinase A [Myxococcota bacterium]